MENGKLDLILKKLNDMDSKIDKLDDRLQNVEKDVKDIKNTVDKHVMKDISSLEKRIEKLEKAQ